MSELVAVATSALIMVTVFGAWWFVSARAHKRYVLGADPTDITPLIR